MGADPEDILFVIQLLSRIKCAYYPHIRPICILLSAHSLLYFRNCRIRTDLESRTRSLI